MEIYGIEEKKAIERVKKLLENANPFTMPPSMYFSLETILNLIEKQQKEIEIKNNKLNMLKENAGKLSEKVIVDIIENYTGFFGGKNEN